MTNTYLIMSNLIDQLNIEHQQIALTLTQVKQIGIISNEGNTKLLSVKAMFMKHLQKENEELYPILNIYAKNNKILKNNMQVLSLEMKTIIEKTARFYQKYEGSGYGSQFNLDFGNLCSVLFQRFSKEEQILYSEYIKIKNLSKPLVK